MLPVLQISDFDQVSILIVFGLKSKSDSFWFEVQVILIHARLPWRNIPNNPNNPNNRNDRNNPNNPNKP